MSIIAKTLDGRHDRNNMPEPCSIRQTQAQYCRFRVAALRLVGENVYKDTYGYTANAEERADDFNAMVADNSIKMVLSAAERAQRKFCR